MHGDDSIFTLLLYCYPVWNLSKARCALMTGYWNKLMLLGILDIIYPESQGKLVLMPNYAPCH
jgi:hypothetical protein